MSKLEWEARKEWICGVEEEREVKFHAQWHYLRMLQEVTPTVLYA